MKAIIQSNNLSTDRKNPNFQGEIYRELLQISKEMTTSSIEMLLEIHGKNTGRGSHSLPGDLTDPDIKPRSPTLQADSLPSEPPGKPKYTENATN